MRPELGAVRQRYLSLLAAAFVAIPLSGCALILWLGMATPSSLFDSWPGRLLAVFAVVWWFGAMVYFRGLVRAAVQAPHALGAAKVVRLHACYWVWLGVYAFVAAILYAAARVQPAAPPLFNWVQCLLLQVVAAVLVGMPFYLLLLSALGGLIAAVGVERPPLSVEAKLLLMAVLTPLTAGAALMYVHWWYAASWSLQDLLVWCAGGLLLAAVGLLGAAHLRGALKPLGTILDAAAPRPEDLAQLRPASADEFGLLIQSLSRLGVSLGYTRLRPEALMEAVSEAIVITDAQGRIVLLNAAAERLLGQPGAPARGMAIATLLPDLHGSGGLAAAVDQAREMQARQSGGEAVAVSVRVRPLGTEGPPGYLCLISPAAHGHAPPRRHEAEEPLRELVAASRDFIWCVDRSGRWSFVNDAARHIYGMDPAEMIGRDIHAFTDAEHRERELAAFRTLWEGRDWLEFESVHHDQGGALHHLSIMAQAHKDAEGKVTRLTGITRDVTARKMYEQKLAYQASHDALTGLFNRLYLRQELERMVARVSRGGPGGVLMFLDLDQLKFINDTLGHGVGDRLLREAALLMKTHIREGDLLARYGGDEFTVLLYSSNETGARTVAENLRARFGEYRFLEGGNAYSLTCSIGLALLDREIKSADEGLDQAERACNSAKNLGRNQVVFHSRETSSPTRDEAWVERIRHLIEEERFQLVYQPIAAIASGSVYDYEVLLRMVEQEGRVLTPGAFLPTAERLGLSRRLDRSVVAKAIRALADLRAAGQPLRFFVNLTARSLRDEMLLPAIRQTLAETRLDGSVLTFEITETAAVADLAAATAFIDAVKEIGARVVLEHFGQGFSSFTYLRHLAVDALKIEGSYVQDLAKSVVNQVVVRSINQVAHALGKITIAPQVENKEALTLLRDLGVDYAQGYFVGRPEGTIGTERHIRVALP